MAIRDSTSAFYSLHQLFIVDLWHTSDHWSGAPVEARDRSLNNGSRVGGYMDPLSKNT